MLPNPMLPSAEDYALRHSLSKRWWQADTTTDDEHRKLNHKKKCHTLNGVAIHYCHEAEIDEFDRRLGLPPDKTVACPQDVMGYFTWYHKRYAEGAWE